MKVYYLLSIIIFNSILNNQIRAEQCIPSDPLGENPGNLCPNQYMPHIDRKFHVIGHGTAAFQGASNDIRYPGKKVINSPIRSDFFTNVSSGDNSNGVRIMTNNGKVFHFPSEQ